MNSRAAPEGERKQVTVLFADVKGSMELAEQVDPEEGHQLRTVHALFTATGATGHAKRLAKELKW